MLSNFKKITDFSVKPEELSQLIGMVDNGTITRRSAENIIEDKLKSGKNANVVVSEQDLFQICNSTEINKIVQEYIDNHMEMVDDYKIGREKLFCYLIGQIMEKTERRLNIQTLNKVLRKRLLNE